MLASRRRNAVLDRSSENISIVSFRGCHFFANRHNKIESRLLVGADNYDARNFAAITKFVHEGSVCLDVGANIGIYAAVMAKLSGSTGQVHAFEPVPHIRRKLRANLALNGFDWVRVNEFALGACEGVFDMYQVVEGEFRGGTSTFLRNENVERMGEEKFQRVPVQVKTLDNYANAASLEKVDFIKIDVEGFEWMVIKGGSKLIEKYKPTILMEYEESRHQECASEIQHYFEGKMYKVFQLMTFGGELVLVPFHFDHNPPGRNILCMSILSGDC